MRTTKAVVKFILREDKKKKDGTCPVYMQVNFRGREQMSIGISVLQKDWSINKQCVKSSSPDYMLCNSVIQKALSNVVERETYYIKNSIIINEKNSKIKYQMKMKNLKNYLFIKYPKLQINRMLINIYPEKMTKLYF